MEFGVPKEIRILEKRVGLTPAGVAALTAGGHRVWIEHNAGAGAGFRDETTRMWAARSSTRRPKPMAGPTQ